MDLLQNACIAFSVKIWWVDVVDNFEIKIMKVFFCMLNCLCSHSTLIIFVIVFVELRQVFLKIFRLLFMQIFQRTLIRRFCSVTELIFLSHL